MIHLPIYAFFWLDQILSPPLRRNIFDYAHLKVQQDKQDSVIPKTLFLLCGACREGYL